MSTLPLGRAISEGVVEGNSLANCLVFVALREPHMSSILESFKHVVCSVNSDDAEFVEHGVVHGYYSTKSYQVV